MLFALPMNYICPCLTQLFPKNSSRGILALASYSSYGASCKKVSDFAICLCNCVITEDMNLKLVLVLERQILDSSRLNELADDNFKFNENGRKFSKQVENAVGKGEIARYKQFLLFPQCFQKTCTADM